MEKVLRAAAFAAIKHEGQYRKSAEGRKVPYVTHPLRVAAALARYGVLDEDVIAAAVCHDIMEDTATTWDELVGEIGERAAGIVAEVTDPKGLKGAARIEAQVEKAPRMSYAAKMLKVGDKTDNMASIIECPPPWTRESKVRYVESAERVVRALGLPPCAIMDAFEEKLATLRIALSEAA